MTPDLSRRIGQAFRFAPLDEPESKKPILDWLRSNPLAQTVDDLPDELRAQVLAAESNATN